MQFQCLLDRGRGLVEMGLEKGREMGEAAAKVAADTAKAAADTAKAAADTALAASSKSVTIEGRQYLLTRLIAEGGFAYVYWARDAASGERYAVKKVLAQDRASAEIAETELAFLRSLPPHPNVIRLAGGCKQPAASGAGDEYLFALELCSGGALTKHVKPGARRLSEAGVLRRFVDVCKGVAHMHSQQPPVAHRDLKLENVLEDRRGTCVPQPQPQPQPPARPRPGPKLEHGGPRTLQVQAVRLRFDLLQRARLCLGLAAAAA